ncbi:MAG TPA: hypothetical protein PKZ84_09345 [Anaerolineae bacterium]|nr:hypothetical protein [Anaerolineae bacterium]HQI84762.1 hypothetical protein [Anaerolineae bacterium]
MNNPDDFTGHTYYQIQVKGRLDAAWADWFDHFEITYHEGYTVLTGPVADQSALLGLLLKLHDLGLTVITVNPVMNSERL